MKNYVSINDCRARGRNHYRLFGWRGRAGRGQPRKLLQFSTGENWFAHIKLRTTRILWCRISSVLVWMSWIYIYIVLVNYLFCRSLLLHLALLGRVVWLCSQLIQSSGVSRRMSDSRMSARCLPHCNCIAGLF